MNRTAVNPVEWGLGFQMNQAEVVEGASRVLRCSGQVALAEDPGAEMGLSPSPVGDIRGQTAAALASIDAILEEAGMSRGDIVFLNFFTTDMDGFLGNYDVYAEWITEAGIKPPQSLLGVARLVDPDLLIEIEATAAQ